MDLLPKWKEKEMFYEITYMYMENGFVKEVIDVEKGCLIEVLDKLFIDGKIVYKVQLKL